MMVFLSMMWAGWINSSRSCKGCPGRPSKRTTKCVTSIVSALWSIITQNQCSYSICHSSKLNWTALNFWRDRWRLWCCLLFSSIAFSTARVGGRVLAWPNVLEQDTRWRERQTFMPRVAGLNSAAGKIFFSVTLQRSQEDRFFLVLQLPLCVAAS